MNAYEEGMAVINAHRRIPLTPREKWVLCQLAKDEKADLTWAKGGGCYYLRNTPVGNATINRLHLKVYISVIYESNSHDYIIYGLNEDGKRVAATLGADCGASKAKGKDTTDEEDDDDETDSD